MYTATDQLSEEIKVFILPKVYQWSFKSGLTRTLQNRDAIFAELQITTNLS